MHIVSFEAPQDRSSGERSEWRRSYGVSGPEGTIADVGRVLAGRYQDLQAVLDAGALDDLRSASEGAPVLDAGSVRLLTPLPEARRIFCIGVNYRAHRDEMGRQPGREEPEHPTVFVRFARSLVGHGTPIVCPPESAAFDYEGELAVVIGRSGRRIDAAAALAHVAGYSCFLDGTLRDFQRHSSQFTPGKNFDRSGAFGPALVTADEVGDPSALLVRTRVSGAVLQEAPTADMIFCVPDLVAYLSVFTELQPGDVVATGTPGGVGVARQPPRFLHPGDTVEVEIPGVGVLGNRVVEEGAGEGMADEATGRRG